MYCGPPGAGKSTNLAWLHREAKAEKRGELLTTAVGRDRTLWFDFEPLHQTVFRDFTIRFLVVTVAGKTVSGATHKQLMRGADGVVFVADSSPDRLYDTLTSYRETAKSLEAHQLEAGAVPVVLQYNKRDVERALSRAELDEGLNPRKHDVFMSVATLGDGVLETFHDALRRTLASIAPHNESLPLLKGMSIEAWSAALIQGLYGRPSFSQVAPSPQRPQQREDSRPIPVLAMPFEVGPVVHDVASEPSITRRLSLADFEAALAHSQAKTAAAAAPPAPAPPPAAKPAAQPLYDGLRGALEAAEALAAGASVEATVTGVLVKLVEASAAVSASLLVPAKGGVRVAASHPLSGDIVARSSGAGRLVAALAGREVGPRVHEAASNPTLADAFRGQGAGRVISAPLRSSRGLHGLLLVYLAEEADAPPPELVAHVGAVATALALVMRYR